ncbi:MAG: KH domain-containing protein [Ignavibacteriaceae bacterium]|nr:KH domain-containing protein [Ignavibacteriaceae bacterium]
MKEFVEFIVKQLVDKPEKVKIEENIQNQNTIEIKVEVEKNDIGKVIGKKGKNINALRTLLSAVAAKENHRVTLQVIE